jgi:hypothetical protein
MRKKNKKAHLIILCGLITKISGIVSLLKKISTYFSRERRIGSYAKSINKLVILLKHDQRTNAGVIIKKC